MRALLCRELGSIDNLEVGEIAPPRLGDGQIRIRVHASGVNFPDILMAEGKYQVKPELPLVPGLEVSGEVLDGASGITHVRPGDRVMAFARRGGGHADEIVLPGDIVTPIPDAMDFVTAAAFPVAYGTAHFALKDRANIQPGESLLVLGAAGGVGLAAVELGKVMGAKVIAAASSEEKVQVAKDHGAQEGFVYPHQPLDRDQQKALSNQIKELTDGQGADVIYDPVGGDYCEPALRATNWEGRFLIIGFPAGIAKIPMNLTLLKGCQIVGVFWGAFTAREPQRNKENIAELMKWYTEGKIKPFISSRYDLEHAGDAIRELMDRKAKGKVVVTME